MTEDTKYDEWFSEFVTGAMSQLAAQEYAGTIVATIRLRDEPPEAGFLIRPSDPEDEVVLYRADLGEWKHSQVLAASAEEAGANFALETIAEPNDFVEKYYDRIIPCEVVPLLGRAVKAI